MLFSLKTKTQISRFNIMKVLIPESTKDITLRQFQYVYKLELRDDISEYGKVLRKVKLFTGLTSKQINNVSEATITEIFRLIDESLMKECPFEQIFTFKGEEFGMIPNLSNMTFGEWVDLSSYRGSEQAELHKIMAILFRPVIKKDKFDNYEIEPYNGTEEYAESFKDLPMNIVNGALGFFLTLSNELQTHIQRFIKEEDQVKAMKQHTTLKNGGGIQVSTT